MTQADLHEAREILINAIRKLQALNHDERTRELSLAITNADQALLWLNKDLEERGMMAKEPVSTENESEKIKKMLDEYLEKIRKEKNTITVPYIPTPPTTPNTFPPLFPPTMPDRWVPSIQPITIGDPVPPYGTWCGPSITNNTLGTVENRRYGNID